MPRPWHRGWPECVFGVPEGIAKNAAGGGGERGRGVDSRGWERAATGGSYQNSGKGDSGLDQVCVRDGRRELSLGFYPI